LPTEALSLFERAGKEQPENDGSHPLVATRPGLPQKSDKILANDYMNFSELLPVKRKGWSVP